MVMKIYWRGSRRFFKLFSVLLCATLLSDNDGLLGASERVLFVGKSLTHRIRDVDLPNVVLSASVTIAPHFHTNCGQSLGNTLEDPTATCAALKAPYTNGSIHDKLGGEPWSAIVFQPFSGTAQSELKAIKTMIDIHRCVYPDNRPEIYLYATPYFSAGKSTCSLQQLRG